MESLSSTFSLLQLLLLTCIFLLLVYTVYVFILHRQYAHIPTPKGAWFYFGQLPILSSEMKKGTFIWEILMKWQKECGPIFCWWTFHNVWIVVSDREAIKVVSTIKCVKPVITSFTHVWNRERLLGKSIFTVSAYNDWKNRRRTFDPSFGRSYLQSLVPHFNEVIQRVLIDHLKICADGHTAVDMKERFAITASQVISWVAFGTDFSKDPYVQSLIGDKDLLYPIRNTLEGVERHMRNPILPYLKPFLASKYTTTARQLRDIGRHCIEERIKAIENKQEVPQDILTNILSLTLKNDDLTIEDLVDDFAAFYIAGQETTSNALSFALVLLLQHPEILERVVAEIDEVLSDKETVSYEDLDKLIYMTAVLEETLRLYPFGNVLRKNIEDITLCDYKIPKNTWIVAFGWGTHRNPENYQDPLKFDPSRFEPGQKRPSPYIYFPFGIGYRSCIGRTFAMMEAKVILALLFHHFSLTLPDNYQLKCEHKLTTRPLGQIPCTLTSRKNLISNDFI